MNITKYFFRLLLSCLSIIFFTSFAYANFPLGSPLLNIALGACIGLVFSLIIFFAENVSRRANLKNFNTITLGLFFGYLLGVVLSLVFSGIIELAGSPQSTIIISFIKGIIYLTCIYLGIVITARSVEEFYVSIPFVKLKPKTLKKKDIFLDISGLFDARIIDLAASGILDNQLVLPRFVLNEIYAMTESDNEQEQHKARKALEVLKKLETIPSLELRYTDTDFPKTHDSHSRIISMARTLDANVLTADISLIEQASIEGVRVINMHSLAKALKPLTQNGEFINIKVQRYGKETRQGVGYLDDGTMVVINGGAEFIGEVIKAQVLSVKHTTSGRMIFCNAAVEGYTPTSQEIEKSLAEMENAPTNYYTH